jgi:NAD(P)-dependent dehydrogenase (short-subunit alcohol dehydrogenase family)
VGGGGLRARRGRGGTRRGRALRGGRDLRALGAVGARHGTQRRGDLRALLGSLRPGLRAALGGRGRGALGGGLRRGGLRALLRGLRTVRGGRLRGRGPRGLGALRGLTLRGHARAAGPGRLLGSGVRGESARNGTCGGRAEGRVGGLVHRLSPGGASYEEKNAPSALIPAITTTARITYVWGKAQLAVPIPRFGWRDKVRRMATSAVVTGAARGFGKEIARRLVARGHHVLITDVEAEAVAAAAAELGAGCTGIVADARSAADHRRAAAAAAELGPVTVWVNNAGVLRAGKAWELTEDAVDGQVAVNLLGVVHGSRAAVEAMRGRGGHLLNIASMSAHGPVPGLAVYAATKAAVLSFTTSLAGELALAGLPIRAHALCPDAADTALVRGEQAHADTAILFSRPALLTADAVADAAVALLAGRRIVRSLPPARAGLARIGGLLPVVGLPVLARLRARGERRRVAVP